MSLLLASAIAAHLISIAEIDLASPDVYVSPSARKAIATGSTSSLACVVLPKRSRKFRTACLTSNEWQRAAKRAEIAAQGRRLDQSEALAQNFASERFNDDTFSLLPR